VPRPAIPVVAVALLTGVGLRIATTSDLWLDEALSVNIAALPLGDLLEALRRDGHPPLYYLLLHGWMQLVGEGDTAVRLLSALLSVATLPLAWIAGRRYAGPWGGAAAVVLLATSPFAIRYATEARMYALVMLLVLAGWLVVRAALERPTALRLAALALLTGLLALSHYWSLYLLAAIAGLLLLAWRRGRPNALPVLGGLAAGALVFLPWLPSFLAQLGSTGTPWGRPERPTNVVAIAATDWGGGPYGEAQLLAAALGLLVLLALLGRAVDDRRTELDLATRPAARPEAAVVALTLAVSVVVGYATAGAFASRYTAVVFPLVVLLGALGITAVPRDSVRAGFLVAVALLGLVGGVRNLITNRTQNGDIARYVASHGSPGDVVGFCPDQLGPATARYLPEGFEGFTYPELGDPRFVDWVDYGERQAAGDPAEVARALDERAGGGDVWLVWSGEYRTLEERCEGLVNALLERRPGGTPVVPSGEQFEHAWLYQYGPGPPGVAE
jgi:mannosyltransferase